MKIFYFLLFLSAAIFSCNSNSKKNSGDNSKAEADSLSHVKEHPHLDEISMYAIIDNLNVRDSADTKSDVVGRLKFGQRAVYFGEESEYKEKINLRGLDRIDTWKRIKFSTPEGSKEGWVFGGGIESESDRYMKNFAGTYTRTITRATREEISQILGMEIGKMDYFDGDIFFQKDSLGRYYKQGHFKLWGTPKTQPQEAISVGIKVKTEISGTYENNKPNGILEEKLEGYENIALTTILFENGTCSWVSIVGNAEGEDYSHRLENPSECNFEAIYSEDWQ